MVITTNQTETPEKTIYHLNDCLYWLERKCTNCLCNEFYHSNTVAVINVATNTVVDSIAVGNNPFGVTVTKDGSKVYVANYLDGTVSVISTATNTVTATITVGSSVYGVSVTPDGSKVYVIQWSAMTVSVINTATNTVTDVISGFNGRMIYL